MQQYKNTLKAEYAKSEDEKQDIETFNFEGNFKKNACIKIMRMVIYIWFINACCITF